MYYIIYRQDSNNNQFVTLDSVNSDANSYTDFDAPSGMVSYRIGAVMPSTCVPSSKNSTNMGLSNIKRENTTGIEETIKKDDVKLYPNPAEKVVTVAFDSKNRDVSIRFVDVTGKTVLKRHKSSLKKEQIEISTLPSGIYIVEIETGKGVVQKKLHIQK